jgi:outer membrane protein
MKKIIFIAILMLSHGVVAQTRVWTLDDCIRYAIEHNPQRKQQEAQNRIYGISRQESVAAFLPSLSANSSVSSNFGRGVDPETNTYISTNTFGNSYSIYSQLTLFDGLSTIYSARLARINQLRGCQQLQDVKDRIALETMELFYNTLYYKGTVALAEQQLQESVDNMKRFQRMEQLGMKAAPDVAESRAKEAEDRFLLTQQRNLLRIETLKLKEKMNLPAEEELEVAFENSGSISADLNQINFAKIENPLLIFSQAQAVLPKLVAARYALKATEAEFKIARGRLFPSIALEAGFSTGFSRLMDGSPYMSFAEQLKNRQGSYVGVGISVPLFDRLARPAETRRAKQCLVIARSEHEATLRQACSEIEQAVADVEGLRDETAAAVEKTQAMEEAHRVNSRKYEEGLIDAIELTSSANRLLNARVGELHAKLKYQLKCRLLDYYKGETSWTKF